MIVIDSVAEFVRYRNSISELSLGFVPTMGALHEGHAALLEASLQQNVLTCLSIYVNETQFNNPEDLAKYPGRREQDLALAESLGVDVVFKPSYADMYPDDYRYQLDEHDFSRTLCGAHRPGHFTGVLTVVMKLLNIVKPSKAYFGEKDCQQLKLIEGMVEAFFLDVDIIAVPTKREADGLAMSSRNLNLTPENRLIAPELNAALASSLDDDQIKTALTERGFDVDYLETIGERRFAAASLGDVRLIDNVVVQQ